MSEERPIVTSPEEISSKWGRLFQKDHNLLRTIIDHLPDMIYVLDDEARFVLNNQAHLEFIDATQAEMVGKTDLDAFPGDLGREYYTDNLHVLHSGQTLQKEEPAVHKTSAGKHWMFVTKTPLRDDNGKVIGLVGISRDITWSKQNEEALLRITTAVESSSNAIIITDINRNVIYTNKAFEELIGYTVNDLDAPDGLWKLYGNPLTLQEIFETVQYGISWIGEIKMETRRNQTLTILLRADGVKNGLGEIIGMVAVHTDITERKKFEQLVQYRESLLEAIATIAAKLLKSLDWEEHIQKVLAILGLASGASRVYIFQNYTLPNPDVESPFPILEQPTRLRQCYEWTTTGVQPQLDNPDLQSVVLRENGFSRWEELLSQNQIVEGAVATFPAVERPFLESQGIHSLVVVPIFIPITSDISPLAAQGNIENPSGFWWGMIGFDECTGKREWSSTELDILRAAAEMLGTAIHRKMVHEQLKRNETRLKLALESARQGLWDYNLITREINCSDIVAEILAYQPQELDPQFSFWQKIIHSDHHRNLLRVFRDHIRGKLPLIEVEIRAQKKTGEWIWLLAKGRIIAFDKNRTPLRMMGTIQDITTAVEHREELRRAQLAAEDANRTKSAFLANMSHEIRTPLNGVIGMTSLLLGTSLDAAQREFVETIRLSGDTLLTLLNDILDFSKIEAGKMAMEWQPFHIRDCVEAVIDLLLPQANAKNIKVTYSIQPDVPDTIVNDVTRLRQVLANLLSNAVKFTEQGSVSVDVTLQPENALPSHVPELLQNTENHPNIKALHFSVKDSGIGFSPQQYQNLFQPFSQLDDSMTRKYGGTGLGLAITKRLVEMMGGIIWAESEGISGKGSTFHFTIPLITEGEKDTSYPLSSAYNLKEKRLLIVDDNPVNLAILRRYAELWGMTLHETDSPRQALEWVCANSGRDFDLALFDYQMPEMDGLQLAEEIRKCCPACTLPLILLSSGEETEINSSAITTLLPKPIKPSTLQNTFIRVLTGNQPDQAALPYEETPIQLDTTPGSLRPYRILLVEDNLINQKVTLRMLQRLGYNADLAANGIEAIQALQRQTYDVVLMDIQMPEMDGEEATRHIRKTMAPNRQPYVIAMTANAMKGDRERYLSASMNDYISKPIQTFELQEVLERISTSGFTLPR